MPSLEIVAAANPRRKRLCRLGIFAFASKLVEFSDGLGRGLRERAGFGVAGCNNKAKEGNKSDCLHIQIVFGRQSCDRTA